MQTVDHCLICMVIAFHHSHLVYMYSLHFKLCARGFVRRFCFAFLFHKESDRISKDPSHSSGLFVRQL